MAAQMLPVMDRNAPITPVATPMSLWSAISIVVMTMATPSVYPMKTVPRNSRAMACPEVFSLQVATAFGQLACCVLDHYEASGAANGLT